MQNVGLCGKKIAKIKDAYKNILNAELSELLLLVKPTPILF